MGKIQSRTRQLRFQLQAKEGKKITVEDMADRIGIDRKVLTRIERNQVRRWDGDVMARIADYYHQQGFDASDILKYDPEAMRSPSLVAA